MYQVHQIVLTPDYTPVQLNAHREVMCFGSKGYKPDEHREHYNYVANVEANNPEHAFHVMNRWTESDEARVTRHAPLHSLSVGDVLIDFETGKAVMVDSYGFADIDFTSFE